MCECCVCVSVVRCILLLLTGARVHMLASTVSSKFLQRMASIEGFHFEVYLMQPQYICLVHTYIVHTVFTLQVCFSVLCRKIAIHDITAFSSLFTILVSFHLIPLIMGTPTSGVCCGIHVSSAGNAHWLQVDGKQGTRAARERGGSAVCIRGGHRVHVWVCGPGQGWDKCSGCDGRVCQLAGRAGENPSSTVGGTLRKVGDKTTSV